MYIHAIIILLILKGGIMIKEYIQKIQSGDCSSSEITLTGICLILFGIVIGMLIAPGRLTVMGSFNGNQGSIEKPKLIKK